MAAAKKTISDLLSGYTAEEIAEYLSTQEKLLKEIEAKTAAKKKADEEKKRLELQEKITQLIGELKDLVQQYLPLQGEPEPGRDLNAVIRSELEEAGMCFKGHSPSGANARPRGPKGQYKGFIAAIFTNKSEIKREDFLFQLAGASNKTIKQLNQRYASKDNQYRDGIIINGKLVTPVKVGA